MFQSLSVILLWFILARCIPDGCIRSGSDASSALICYPNSNHPLISVFQHYYSRINPKSIEDVALNSCKYSSQRKFTIQSKEFGVVAIMLIKPSPCHSTGNMIGNYYEAMSLAINNNFILGRILDDCDGQKGNSSVIGFLPMLIIPNRPITQLTENICSAIPSKSPWDNAASLFWSNARMVSMVNRMMIENYLNHFKVLKNVENEMKSALSIHYRCRDNIISDIYGIFPFSVYRQLLSRAVSFNDNSMNNISKIIIFSDAKQSEAYGTVCWSLLGLLRDHISNLPQFSSSRIDIVYSNPSLSFTMLHYSKITLCSVSTYCFYSTMGPTDSITGKRIVYLQQSSPLLNAPESFWILWNENDQNAFAPFQASTMVKPTSMDWKAFVKKVSTG
jgi:hypothetical protein